MKRLPKPELSQNTSYWVNPEILPKALRDNLLKRCRTGKLNEAQSLSLIDATSEEVQWCLQLRAAFAANKKRPQDPNTQTTPDEVKNELESVATEARRLLRSIRALSKGTVLRYGAAWDTLVFVNPAPVKLSPVGMTMRGFGGQFLEEIWPLVEDLEHSARYASEQIEPSRQSQIKRIEARGLSRRIAERYRSITGALPPYSKETWFPLFMEELCAWEPLGLRCGPAIVKAGVLLVPSIGS